MFIYTATLSILATILQKTHLAITTFSNYSAKNTFSNRCCHNICEIYSRQSLHSHSTTRGKRHVLEQRKGNEIFNTNTNTKSTSESCSGLALSLPSTFRQNNQVPSFHTQCLLILQWLNSKKPRPSQANSRGRRKVTNSWKQESKCVLLYIGKVMYLETNGWLIMQDSLSRI